MVKPLSLALCLAALPAAALAARPAPLAWIITPAEAACRTELELTARSGAITTVQLVSDGQIVSLTFAKPDLPERAFLPIRVDQQRFSNLMLRRADGQGELVLSEETEAALKKGKTLAVAWLGQEPLAGPLSGSEQGLADLRSCGAQVKAQGDARLVAERAAKTQAEAEARAQAIAQAQIEAARAQAAAADAERRRVAEAAERQRRDEAAEARRIQGEAYERERARAYAEAERRRAYEDEEPAYLPPRPQPWYPPRYGFPRY